MSKTLTAKQAAFIREYAVDMNATQAAIRAGYSQRTAASIGLENLRKPLIAKYVANELEAQANRTHISVELVIAGLLEEATNQGSPASARVAAWGWLGKHLAMFTDRRDKAFGGEPIQTIEYEHGVPSTNGKKNGKPSAVETRMRGG